MCGTLGFNRWGTAPRAFQTSDGGTVHAEVHGRGQRAVVLVPGLRRHARLDHGLRMGADAVASALIMARPGELEVNKLR